MWRWTLGSSLTPGQHLMAQGGLDFQSGWSHEVLQYLWSAQSSPGPMSQPPLQMRKLLQTVAPRRTEVGAPWTQWISPLLQQQPDFPGSGHQDQAPHQLGISQDSAWPQELGLLPARTSMHHPSMCATWQCLCLILLLPHSPALCHTAGSPIPMQPTPKRRTLKLLLPLVRGAEHGNLRC